VVLENLPYVLIKFACFVVVGVVVLMLVLYYRKPCETRATLM
jgi:hypothetical protein